MLFTWNVVLLSQKSNNINFRMSSVVNLLGILRVIIVCIIAINKVVLIKSQMKICLPPWVVVWRRRGEGMTPFSRSHEDLDCWKRLENCLSAPYLLKEQMDLDHTCTSRLLGQVKEHEILVSLTPFSSSHDGLDGWKMTCLHPISWMNGWVFTKLVHLIVETWERTD